MARAVTDQQRAVLEAIKGHWREHARSPTVRELMGALGFASPQAITGHLKSLAAKGAVELDAGSRGIWPAGLRGRIRAAVDASAQPELLGTEAPRFQGG